MKNGLVPSIGVDSGVDSVDSLCKTDELILLQAGDKILTLKKLHYNEWYVYLGTSVYYNYICTGINKVHSSE